jgi:LmbE family N-acetylglucosaminyl deacetylase
MSTPETSRTPLLAFGAHPDDIEFGCGAVIARETRAGRPAHFVGCSRGASATHGTPAQRTREAEISAAALGATLEFGDLGGDAHFEMTVANTIALAAIIRRVRPAVVLAPSPMENQHPDHAKLGRMVRDAARLARYGGVAELTGQAAHAIGALLFYAITPDAESHDAGTLGPVFVDVSAPEIVATWKTAMETHASQMRTRKYVEMQLARARVNGLRCGAEYAIALFPSEPVVVDSLAALERGARSF